MTATDAGRAHKAFGAMIHDAYPVLFGEPHPVAVRPSKP